ncbi:2-hydroxyacyl-CoA dehydratase [Thermodesulfobacteriota bacterium]
MTYPSTKGAGTASTKRLRSSAAVRAYQKEWFMNLKDRASQGEPVVYSGILADADILTAMDISHVTSPWWSAIVAAKRLSGFYNDIVAKHSYDLLGPDYEQLGPCANCGAGWARLYDDPEHAPYGGLPKITAITTVGGRCRGSEKVTNTWLRRFDIRRNIPVFRLNLETTLTPYYPRYQNWWEKIEDHWDEVLEPHKLDYAVEELKALIRFLENLTGKTFSQDRLTEVLELSNEQNRYWRKARDLIAKTSPAPVDVVDQLAQYPAQWHRGTPMGRDLAKMFYEEVKEMVENGVEAYPNEKIRLQWLRQGNFGNTAFYQYFGEKYGAVFVTTEYLSIASDGYPRNPLNDPLRAIAGRALFIGMYTGVGWEIKEARHHNVKGAVGLETHCATPWHTGILMQKRAYEDAGIPMFAIPLSWNADKQKTEISRWLETRLLS